MAMTHLLQVFLNHYEQLWRMVIQVPSIQLLIFYLDDCNANLRFNMKHGMWTTGTNSPFELIQGSKKYTVKGITQKIKCPTSVLEAEKDDSFPGQPRMVYDALTCPKKYILFTSEEGAEEHCQSGPFQTNVFLIG